LGPERSSAAEARPRADGSLGDGHGDRPPNPVLAEVIRSGAAESWHRGSVVVLDVHGGVLLSAGVTDRSMYPRSANKPMQATAMIGCGLNLHRDSLLALAAASHSGEDFHVSGVQEILGGVGLDESDLQCPPDWPLDESAKINLIGRGGRQDRLHMNCSGKHAAMLATCVAQGWPTASYRDPAHPLQERIRRVIEDLTREPVTAIGVDGCGAPLMSISLAGLARAFSGLVRSPAGSAERAVADAMRAYPEWMSGTARYEARLMSAVPGLLMKPGADGVCAFALPDGRAAAVKIDDGAQRAVAPVVAALLRELIAIESDGPVSHGVLDELGSAAVLGGGQPVGEIRPVLPPLH
jgi:L-asparaginase II